MKITIKKIFIFLIFIISIIVFLSYYSTRISHLKSIERQDLINKEKLKATIPDSLNIKMTFFPQAPYADWALPYQEACEEASILLAANLLNKMNLDKKTFNIELLKLIEWEKVRFGDYLHTNTSQTEIMINEYFKLKTILHEDPTFEKIASIIAKGNIIIAPFAGKLLKNPYFTNGGPKYHMLVIKGYNLTTKEMITNDVGTRRGLDFVYSWECIQNAIHDWNDEDILSGKKLIIEVFP